jgi:hypothetical protein
VWSPRLFWGFQAAIWFISVFLLLVQLTTFQQMDHFGSIALGRLITGVLLTTFLHFFYQTARFRSQKRALKWLIVIVLSAGLSFVAALVWMGLVHGLGFHEVEVDDLFYNLTITRLIGLLMWNMTYFCVDLFLASNAIKLDAARTKLAAQAGELKQLQDQLNPHFLFNALNIVKASTAKPPVAAEAVQILADYLRFALQTSRPLEPLSRELDALELYLRLQYIRFQDGLDCSIEATPEAMKTMVPPMLVQPLLENAFKYGARTSPLPLRVHVRACIASGRLTIAVANSGAWVPPDSPAAGDTGIGLANLRRRLALVYGPQAAFDIGEVDGMVTASLRLPVTPGTTG